MTRIRLSRIVAALAACAPGLAIADPVTLIALGSQLAVGGAFGAALTISATTAAWIGVGSAVFGMARARKQQRKLAQQARAQQVASLADRNYRALTNLPPRETVYGEPYKAGYIVDSFATDLTTTGADGITRTYPDGLRHLVFVWAAHECTAIGELLFGADTIQPHQFGADGWALQGSVFHRGETATRAHQAVAGTSILPAAAAQVLSVVGNDDQQGIPYTLAADRRTITVGEAATVTYTVTGGLSMLRVSHHLGQPGQAVDSYLSSIAPARYTAAHTLTGLCYTVMTFDLRFERWQSGPPSPVAQIRGKKVYDPRTSQYAHSFNPALHALDFLLDADGMDADLIDVPTGSVIAAANACEQSVTFFENGIASVNAPRYIASGTWETGASRETVLDDLCDAMAGSASYAGTWTISAGVYSPPVLALTDDDLAGSISIVQAGAPDDQLCNGVRGVYFPRYSLTPVDMEPYSNPVLVAADGGELWTSLDLPFTEHNFHARQIARIEVETRRNGLVISYPAKPHALRLQPGDRVTVTSAEYGWAGKIFRVTDSTFAPRQSVALTLQEDDAAAWDTIDTAQSDPTPNTGLVSPWGVVAPPTGLAAISGTSVLQVQGDGTIITRVLVTWDAITAPYATAVRVTWAPPGGVPTTVSVPPDQREVYLIGPIDGQTITIGASVRTMAESSQPAYISHLVLGKAEPPPPVLTLAMQELPDLGRVLSWTYPDPIPLDLGGFVARYSGHSSPTAWGGQADLFAAPRDARTHTATSAPPDGEWDITIRAVDTTGNLSTGVTITALLSQGALGMPLMTVKPEALGWPGEKVACAVDGSFLAQAGIPWDSLPATWTTWTVWDSVPGAISYTHQLDLGADSNIRVRVDANANAPVTLELQHSSNGTTWTAWEPIPVGHVNAHHLRVRATVTGSANAYLYNMTINLYT